MINPEHSLEGRWEMQAPHSAVQPDGNQPRVLTGRADAEAEAPVLWPPDAKSRLTGKDPDAGKD